MGKNKALPPVLAEGQTVLYKAAVLALCNMYKYIEFQNNFSYSYPKYKFRLHTSSRIVSESAM